MKQCLLEAVKYRTRTEFQNGSPSAYSKSLNMAWLDIVCPHMQVAGSKYLRALYAYEFSDKTVYVGLTYDYRERHNQHLVSKRTVGLKLRSTQFNYVRLDEWMSKDAAITAEQNLVETYSSQGWIVLNRIKAGGLGGTTRKWFRHACLHEARKYSSRSKFMLQSSGAYEASIKHGWLEEACAHMVATKSKPWTQERLVSLIRRCQNWGEFRTKFPGAYLAAGRLKLLHDLRQQIEPPEEFWSDQTVRDQLDKASSLKSFSKKYPKAYLKCLQNGWATSPRETKVRHPKWSHESLEIEALKYVTRKDFSKGSSGAYTAAAKLNYLDQICRHMESCQLPRGHWNQKVNVATAARKFLSRVIFKLQNGSAYYSAIRNGWLSEVCAHMTPGRALNGEWTFTKVAEEARKFESRTDFFRNSSRAYHAAIRMGYLDEACAHMTSRRIREKL